jgi:TetR/AcrR family transcriptional regulator, transcriptional repressor for nem operon
LVDHSSKFIISWVVNDFRGIFRIFFMANVVPTSTVKKPTLVQPTGPATRQRLVESARYLFWERGFAGTSMSDLLAHAKVNSGSFYHFFDSKEALLREVLESYLVALHPMIVEPAYATTSEPIERIFAILEGYRERILMTDAQYGCPLGRLALEIDPENRPAHKLIAENFHGWIDAVHDCLKAATLPAGTDIEALATYVLATMEGGVMLSRSYGSVDPFDRTVKALREHFRLLMR